MLSILLRTRNNAAEVPRFAGCVEQGFDLVLVDHASTDQTLEIARGWGVAIVPWSNEEYSYGGAINLGVPHCKGEWVIVMSPHARPASDDFWQSLVQSISSFDEDVEACQISIYYPGQRRRRDIDIKFLDRSDVTALPSMLFGNTCCAYRKQALLEYPFDEKLTSSEDADWVYRAVLRGRRVAIDRRVAVFYENRAPLNRFWKKGRTDRPAIAAIFGVSFHPRRLATLASIVRDLARLCLGRIPLWWWMRLTVKRLAELTLSSR